MKFVVTVDGRKTAPRGRKLGPHRISATASSARSARGGFEGPGGRSSGGGGTREAASSPPRLLERACIRRSGEGLDESPTRPGLPGPRRGGGRQSRGEQQQHRRAYRFARILFGPSGRLLSPPRTRIGSRLAPRF